MESHLQQPSTSDGSNNQSSDSEQHANINLDSISRNEEIKLEKDSNINKYDTKHNNENYQGQKNVTKHKRSRDSEDPLNRNRYEVISEKRSIKPLLIPAKKSIKILNEESKSPKDLEAIFSSTFYKFEEFVTEHEEHLNMDINASGWVEDDKVKWRFGISENKESNIIALTLTKLNKIV